MGSSSRPHQLSERAATQPAPGRPPSFVIIGGQRCGTTWLHRAIAEHPAVFVAEPKELHFFDLHYDKGLDWYYGRFTPSAEHRAWGEATPAYLHRPDCDMRLHAAAPDARLVAILRHPVDRAYSAYQLMRNTMNAGMSFEEALEASPELIERGMYADHLERWFALFGRERVLVLLYDDLQSDEAGFVSRVFEHIGVDPAYKPSMLGRVDNAVILPKLRDRLRALGLEPAVQAIKRTPVRRWIQRAVADRKRRGRGQAYSDIPADLRSRLLEHYNEPNDRLARLIGRDLSAWAE